MIVAWWELLVYPLTLAAVAGATWSAHQELAPRARRFLATAEEDVEAAFASLFLSGISARTFVLVRFVAAPVGAVGVLLLTGSVLAAALVGAVFYLTPALLLRYAQQKRRDRLEKQVLDLIHSLSASSKSGMSLLQAIEEIVGRLPAPMSQEFRLVLQRLQAGQSLEASLRACDARVALPNLTLVIQSLLLNESRGGRLPDLLDKISHSLQAIERVEERVKTETSGIKLSSRLMAAMPVVVLFLLYLASPDHVLMLFQTLIGNLILLAALALDFVGFTIIRRLGNLEV